MIERVTGSNPSRDVMSASEPDGSLTGVSRCAWQPILEGAERNAARTVVEEVAEALTQRPQEGPSLAGGSAGRALLHARLASGDPAQREAAMTCLRHAVASLRTPGGPSSLHVGAAGIGWALAHLSGTLLDDRDRCTGLDRALLHLLDRRPWLGRVDLMRGLVGIGVYALERLDAPAGPTLLERVVAHLGDVATRERGDVYWWTPAEWLPEPVRRRSPQGHVDLGVAHGVPGVIALLGAACAADVGADTARPLLDGAVTWLLREGTRGDVLPSWRGSDQAPEPARTAWCYGEPGVAAALLGAARAAGEPTWEDAARRLARRAAARPVEDSGVDDAGLCHGAGGLGLVFARLHQATGEQQFHDAARFWFRHALDLRAPGTDVAGYTAAGVDGPVPDASLLTGATGVALALNAASTDREPTWDRILLLSTAPTVRAVSGGGQQFDGGPGAEPTSVNEVTDRPPPVDDDDDHSR